MTSSASISGFLFGNAADIYPDQAFSCFVGKTVQFASVGYKVSGFPAWMNITGTFTPLVRIEETIVPD